LIALIACASEGYEDVISISQGRGSVHVRNWNSEPTDVVGDCACDHKESIDRVVCLQGDLEMTFDVRCRVIDRL
jgi:hypothetical protein